MAAPTAIAAFGVAAGFFQDSLGNKLSNGRLTFDLSQPAAASGGGEVVPRRVAITLDINGVPSSGQVIWRNTDLSPSGTTYGMKAFDSNGNFVGDFGIVIISGASPIDLTIIVPSLVNTSTVGLSGVVLTNPTVPQTIVGQTLSVSAGLTNTPLTIPSNGNSVTLLNFQGILGAITLDGTDKTIFTYTLPANAIGAGKGIKIRTNLIHSTGTAAITYKMQFGGTAVQTFTVTDSGFQWLLENEVFNNAGVTNAQTTRGMRGNNAGTTTFFANGIAAIDTTAGVIIKITANGAATEQVTPTMWTVELTQ